MQYKILWVILILGFSLCTFLTGSTYPNQISLLQSVILTATLVTIFWYTFETYKLRTAHEKSAEIESFPWLRGSDLVINKDETIENFLWKDTIFLPVRNIGETPAFNLTVQVAFKVQGPDILEQKEYQDIIIAPGDTCHFKIGQLSYHTPSDLAQIDVTIKYKSFLGGEGKLLQNFIYRNKSWANGPSSYHFRLSGGRTYPKNI